VSYVINQAVQVWQINEEKDILKLSFAQCRLQFCDVQFLDFHRAQVLLQDCLSRHLLLGQSAEIKKKAFASSTINY
jgi:hypothetical protein